MKSKILLISGTVLTFLGLAGTALATEYSTSTLSTTFSSLIDSLVDDIISLIVTIFTNNISIIIMLGVAVSLVFWIIYKVRRAGRGG